MRDLLGAACRLMLGLLRPTIGDVRVNGISTRDLDLNQFYESVAYVSQDPPVFDGTIRENLLLQDTQDDKRALEVLNTLGLGEFLERGRAVSYTHLTLPTSGLV